MSSAPDSEAMLVALVLDPSTYSRNRFFGLYKDPAIRFARRRAALIRALIRQLAGLSADERQRALCVESRSDSANDVVGEQDPKARLYTLRFEIPEVGLKRTTRLTRTELSVLRFALQRATSSEPAEDSEDRERIEQALARLVG